VTGESLDSGTVTSHCAARAMVSVRKNLQTAWPGKILADRADLFPKMLASLDIP